MASEEAAMRSTLVLLVLLAVPVLAQDEEIIEEEDVVESVEYAGRIARAERDAPALFVRAREGGVLQVKEGEEWINVTLDGFASRLKRFQEEQDAEMRKTGGSAVEAGASRLFVSLEAEPTVPWLHIQWLMIVAAEQMYYKLELSDGSRRFLAFLPRDKGGRPGAGPRAKIKAGVHLVCREERPAKWGEQDVSRPTQVVYKMGAAESAAIADVADYLRATKRDAAAANKDVAGEIKAGHKTPFSSVLDVIGTFEATGVLNVEFYGTATPTKEERTATLLPFPLRNYLGQ
jgi:hypothetical protein